MTSKSLLFLLVSVTLGPGCAGTVPYTTAPEFETTQIPGTQLWVVWPTPRSVQTLDYYEANRQNPAEPGLEFVSDSIALLGDLAVAYSAGQADYIIVNDPPRAVYSVPPRFPPNAEFAAQEATVWVNVRVLEDGTVGEAIVAQSTNEGLGFERAALESAVLYNFAAARHDGQYVSCWTTIPVEFRLED